MGPTARRSPRPASSSAQARSGSIRRPARSSKAASRHRPSASCATSSAVLEAAGLTLDDVVKTTCFLADIGDFAAFNAVYARFFGDTPARAFDVPGGRPAARRARRDRGDRGATRARGTRRLTRLARGPRVRPPDARTASISARRSGHSVSSETGPDPRGRRARGRARDPDAIAHPEGAAPGLRTPDARLRPRRRRERSPRARRSSSCSPVTLSVRDAFADHRRRSRSRTSRAAPEMPSARPSDRVPDSATELVVLSGDVPLLDRRARGRPRRGAPGDRGRARAHLGQRGRAGQPRAGRA